VVKRKDGRLIDAFVAAILAYAARGQAVEDGALSIRWTPAAPMVELVDAWKSEIADVMTIGF
jgi:hypothetical protein